MAAFLAPEQETRRDQLPNQKSSDRQKGKINQEGIIPVKRIGDPAHHDRIRNFKHRQNQVQTGDCRHPRFPGKEQSGENDHAHQKRTAAESHYQARRQQSRQTTRAEHAAHRAGGIDRHAQQQVPPGADDPRHPGGHGDGAEVAYVIKNDHPADFIGAGTDVALHVRKEHIDREAVGDFDGGNHAHGEQHGQCAAAATGPRSGC